MTSQPFPLTERWAPSPTPRLDERGVTRGFLDHIASVSASAATELVREDPEADVLVFAPGAREVSEIARRVRTLNGAFDVRELHGQTPPAEQDAVIRGRAPGGVPRIIVATSLAESSITVPGVRMVVDSCLFRQPQRDAARGMTGLVTTAASRSSCVQRAGRATRQGPGIVVRCVDERAYAAGLPRVRPRRSATADLTGAALLLACWGAPGGAGLRLIEPLRADSLADARRGASRSRRDRRRRARHGRGAACWPASRPTPGWPGRCGTAAPWWGAGSPPRSSRFWAVISASPDCRRRPRSCRVAGRRDCGGPSLARGRASSGTPRRSDAGHPARVSTASVS
ncbi:helicase-related protein [Microbacterium sp. NRRL B-14842]|uniref:helicase-related protein n=1 Tax=Microbacterium sp. NRRL B-14842 TaxID=3162881 RepID=UPI003D272B9A